MASKEFDNGQWAAGMGMDSVTLVSTIAAKLDEIQSVSDMLLKSGWLPKHLKSIGQVNIVLIKAMEVNIPILEAVSHLFPVGGKVAMDGKIMTSLILRRGGRIVPVKETPESCTLEFIRPNVKPIQQEYTLEQAKIAGLYPKTEEDLEFYLQYWEAYNYDNNNYNALHHKRFNVSWLQFPQEHLRWKCIKRGADIMFADWTMGMGLLEDVVSPGVGGVVMNQFGEVETIPGLNTSTGPLPAESFQDTGATVVENNQKYRLDDNRQWQPDNAGNGRAERTRSNPMPPSPDPSPFNASKINEKAPEKPSAPTQQTPPDDLFQI